MILIVSWIRTACCCACKKSNERLWKFKDISHCEARSTIQRDGALISFLMLQSRHAMMARWRRTYQTWRTCTIKNRCALYQIRCIPSDLHFWTDLEWSLLPSSPMHASLLGWKAASQANATVAWQDIAKATWRNCAKKSEQTQGLCKVKHIP